MLRRRELYWVVVVPVAGAVGIASALAVGSEKSAEVYVLLFRALPAGIAALGGTFLRVWNHVVPGAVAAALVGGGGWFILLWMAARAGLFE
jgi:hypothetical protein